MRCTMPTNNLRTCTRDARYLYLRDTATPALVAAYCSQHYRAGGHARMLRPRPWEYSRVWDSAAGMHVKP